MDSMSHGALVDAYREAGRKALEEYFQLLDNRVSKPAVSKMKCPCCGSREFRVHHDKRICSYCRSEA